MSLIETLRARFEAGAQRPAPLDGDGMLLAEGEPMPAAVLAAIVDRPEPGLLLTRRHDGLRNHAGQVAFPGGRADPGDADAEDTALREAWEEIAMPREAVALIGRDAPYRTVTNFRIVPVVGVVPPGLPLVPHEEEVAELFEVPLAHVLDPARQMRLSGEFRGAVRQYYEIVWGERRIWGATAAMIVNLSRWLRG